LSTFYEEARDVVASQRMRLEERNGGNKVDLNLNPLALLLDSGLD
jgi:hypothetical protein